MSAAGPTVGAGLIGAWQELATNSQAKVNTWRECMRSRWENDGAASSRASTTEHPRPTEIVVSCGVYVYRKSAGHTVTTSRPHLESATTAATASKTR